MPSSAPIKSNSLPANLAEWESLPWERQEGEPSDWYGFFHTYLTLGPRRSMRQAAKLCGHLYEYKLNIYPTSNRPGWLFVEQSRIWRWRERAEAYDAHLIQIEREEFEQARKESRKRRLATLNKLHAKIDQGVENLNPESLDWKTLSGVLRSVMDELRSDYDDMPKQRIIAGVGAEGDEGGPIQFTINLNSAAADPRRQGQIDQDSDQSNFDGLEAGSSPDPDPDPDFIDAEYSRKAD